MFHLFPKKKSIDEIVKDINLTPSWEWTPTQTPSVLQAQNELIEQLLKENYDLKLEKQKLKNEINKWEKDWDEQNKNVSELMKEVNYLRHLKEENVRLIEESVKLNEDNTNKQNILSESLKCIEQLQVEIKEAKNAHCKTFLEAKLQVSNNDYKKCAEERDEYKHQLNAANKELEVLKKEKNILQRWKEEMLEVNRWWDNVDSYIRGHAETPLGSIVANTCLKFLKERDEYKAEVEKLKKDIVDYVIEKDDEINVLLNTQSCNNIQKHPMHPIHLEVNKVRNNNITDCVLDEGISNSEEEAWMCPCNKCRDTREGKVETTDLTARIKKLEKKVEELTILKTQICQK